MIDWNKVNSGDFKKIRAITKRVINNYPGIDRIDIEMDIMATITNQSLDLDKLLSFDDFNFGHDIFGIINNLDRDTGELKNCFLPRSARN